MTVLVAFTANSDAGRRAASAPAGPRVRPHVPVGVAFTGKDGRRCHTHAERARRPGRVTLTSLAAGRRSGGRSITVPSFDGGRGARPAGGRLPAQRDSTRVRNPGVRDRRGRPAGP